jgi:hypothetical protein
MLWSTGSKNRKRWFVLRKKIALADLPLCRYQRTNRPALVQALMRSATQKYQADIDLMTDVANKSTFFFRRDYMLKSEFTLLPAVVADRKANPIEKKDLLNTMLLGKDPKTGQGLDDDTIVKNVSKKINPLVSPLRECIYADFVTCSCSLS